MKGPTPRRLWKYANGCLRLKAYLRFPGDGRPQPRIPARLLLWSLIVGQVLRECTFRAVEFLVRSAARQALEIRRAFGDDALAYFTERLQVEPTRQALASMVQRAKRNKAFDAVRFIGLVMDGTGAGRSRQPHCWLCRPQGQGYGHQLVLVSVIGAGLNLPLDVEPYGPGDSELGAGLRLLRRAVAHLGRRFADYLVVDAEYANARFLHAARELGLRVVARLKANLPELLRAAQRRFRAQPPSTTFRDGQDHVQVWDADDFDPWESLRWETVRVLFYRQHKPDGTVIEAFWLSDFSCRQVSSRSLYHLAKGRWEIENQGFNDAKNRHALEHVCHHQANSLLIQWLLVAFALTLERLWRLRYLHRGTHPFHTAIELVRLLRLALASPSAFDTS